MALMTGMSETRQMAPTYSSAIADAHNYMSWIVGTMRPYFGRDVLEVGIGHGSYHEYLGKLGSYRGIDIDPENVASSRARYLVSASNLRTFVRNNSDRGFLPAASTPSFAATSSSILRMTIVQSAIWPTR
jgi:SAM-dependent methyltransferase